MENSFGKTISTLISMNDSLCHDSEKKSSEKSKMNKRLQAAYHWTLQIEKRIKFIFNYRKLAKSFFFATLAITILEMYPTSYRSIQKSPTEFYFPCPIRSKKFSKRIGISENVNSVRHLRIGRNGEIWTRDLFHPKEARYQAAPRPADFVLE